MKLETVKEVVAWLRGFRKDAVTFTFHGGEPLMAGAGFYRKALPILAGLDDRNVAFAMQSNLWLMTPEIARILAEYNIPIGSSIDGPKDLNDAQRGKGYFDRTMKGYKVARDNGVKVSFICTFTSGSARRKEEILQFFMDNGFPMKLHPALPSLRKDRIEEWALDPEDYGELLVYLLDQYLANMGRVEILNIDHLCKGLFTGRGTVCTFVDCMDSTYAVGPNGDIYPCYRFVGMPDYVLGNVYDRPTEEDLKKSKAGKLLQKYKAYVDKHCEGCAHISYCRGGCPYNAIVPTHGKISGVDPHCVAYKRIFDEIAARYNQEMLGGLTPFGGSGGLESATFGADPLRSASMGIMAIMLKQL